MWTSSALCCQKKKGKRDLKRWWYLKAEKECERKNERGNEQVSKKSKRTGVGKTKNKYKWFKKKGNPDQRLTKTWRGSKTEGEVNVNFVSYYLSLV